MKQEGEGPALPPPQIIKEIKRENAEAPARFGTVETPDTSVAEAIRKMLSDEPQAVAVLANLDESDVTRLSFLTALSIDFKIDWLQVMISSEETLSAAVKGLRSNQITEISRQPLTLSDGGTVGKIKEKLHL